MVIEFFTFFKLYWNWGKKWDMTTILSDWLPGQYGTYYEGMTNRKPSSRSFSDLLGLPHEVRPTGKHSIQWAKTTYWLWLQRTQEYNILKEISQVTTVSTLETEWWKLFLTYGEIKSHFEIRLLVQKLKYSKLGGCYRLELSQKRSVTTGTPLLVCKSVSPVVRTGCIPSPQHILVTCSIYSVVAISLERERALTHTVLTER